MGEEKEEKRVEKEKEDEEEEKEGEGEVDDLIGMHASLILPDGESQSNTRAKEHMVHTIY